MGWAPGAMEELPISGMAGTTVRALAFNKEILATGSDLYQLRIYNWKEAARETQKNPAPNVNHMKWNDEFASYVSAIGLYKK